MRYWLNTCLAIPLATEVTWALSVLFVMAAFLFGCRQLVWALHTNRRYGLFEHHKRSTVLTILTLLWRHKPQHLSVPSLNDMGSRTLSSVHSFWPSSIYSLWTLDNSMLFFRILVQHISSLAPFKRSVEWHISSKYSEEMSTKSNVVHKSAFINNYTWHFRFHLVFCYLMRTKQTRCAPLWKAYRSMYQRKPTKLPIICRRKMNL